MRSALVSTLSIASLLAGLVGCPGGPGQDVPEEPHDDAATGGGLFEASGPREGHQICWRAYGALLELSLNLQRLRHTITQPHEVPARGQEHDRVSRRESYVKDFKAVIMGVIELKKGKGELTLRALKIPGQEALEFRLLMLRRLK